MDYKVTVDDIKVVADFLAMHEELGDTDFLEESGFEGLGRAFPVVIAWLTREAMSREARTRLAQAKRDYAKEHGVPVRSVRVVR